MFRKKSLLVICIIFFVSLISARAEGEVSLSCRAAVLMEANSGTVLFEQNPHDAMPPASITKIMTMLLTMEAIESGQITYDDMVTASERAKSMGGSTIYLDAGEQMSVRDLLKGVAVASANDACVALGEYIAGSEEAFVARMNEKAAALGMSDTVFKNTNGLDAEGHLSSATDIAKMSCALLGYPDIFDFTTIWMDTLRNGAFQLANTNKLIRFYDGANGLKTGSTSGAGCCISATAFRDGMQLVAVILNAPNSKERFADAKTLLDYGFSHYACFTGKNVDEPIGMVPVVKGEQNEVSAVLESQFSYVGEKSETANITEQVEWLPSCTAPVTAGGVLGRIVYLKSGEEIGSVRLLAQDSVKKRTAAHEWVRLCKIAVHDF